MMIGIQNHRSKSCFKCGAEKPLTEFYSHKAMADGYLNKCKDCTKRDSSKRREEKSEEVKAYDRDRPNREQRNKERVQRAKRDYESNPERVMEEQRKYRENNLLKYKARNAVSNAIRDGRLIRPEKCEKCDKVCIPEGHHPSYEEGYWLRVEWLCSSCHHTVHKVYT